VTATGVETDKGTFSLRIHPAAAGTFGRLGHPFASTVQRELIEQLDEPNIRRAVVAVVKNNPPRLTPIAPAKKIIAPGRGRLGKQ
jgi:hypothetical protein